MKRYGWVGDAMLNLIGALRAKRHVNLTWCGVLLAVLVTTGCGIPKEMYTDVTRERDALLSENRRLAAERDDLKTESAKLKSDLAEATKARGPLDEKIDRLAAEKKAVSEERDQLKQRVESLQGQVEQLTGDNESLSGRVESLNAVVESLKQGAGSKP